MFWYFIYDIVKDVPILICNSVIMNFIYEPPDNAF
jgi:hypothetical protein